MINKLQEGSEAYLILKREEDKIRAWRMIYAWYVKVSGQGLQTTMSELMYPSTATKDEEVLKNVERWLDDLREATNQGMDPFNDMAMITILKRLVTPRFKERMDLRDYDNFDQAKLEVLRWASVKFQDGQDLKKSTSGKSNDMDLGFYGCDPSSGNAGDEWNSEEQNEEH